VAAQFVDIFINTFYQQFVQSATNSQVKPAPLMVLGDTPNWRIWIVVPIPNTNPPQYQLLQNNAVGGLQVALCSDPRGSAEVPQTQQYVWTPSGSSDPNQQYWTATIALNTVALSALFTTGTTSQVNVWLEVKVISLGGFPTTIFQIKLPIQYAVITPANLIVPAGQTPLSLEEAMAIFLKRRIIGPVNIVDPVNNHEAVLYVAPDGSTHFDQLK